MSPRTARRSPLLIAAGMAIALSGCQQSPNGAASTDAASSGAPLPAPLPMSTSAPTAIATAPAASALPSARPVRLGRLADPAQGYAYLDRAYAEEDAVADAPPDYAFEDDGVRPWTWAAGDGGRVISEPVPGGYRTYYYQDGADEPYLVRDPEYAYAYHDGVLVGVYTLAGALIGYGAGSAPAMYGSRYLYRGHALWQGAVSGPHLPVNAYNWSDRRAEFAARRAAWQQQMAANAAWQQWHDQHRNDDGGQWQDIRARHEDAAHQFDAWQEQRFAGPPPQFGNGPQPEGPPPATPHPGVGTALVGGAVVAGAALIGHAVMSQHHAAPGANRPAMVPQPTAHFGGQQPHVMPGRPDMAGRPGMPERPAMAAYPAVGAQRFTEPQDRPHAMTGAPAPRPAVPMERHMAAPAERHMPAPMERHMVAPAERQMPIERHMASPAAPRMAPPAERHMSAPAPRQMPPPEMHRAPAPPRPEPHPAEPHHDDPGHHDGHHR